MGADEIRLVFWESRRLPPAGLGLLEAKRRPTMPADAQAKA
jgi:hypothetical protein